MANYELSQKSVAALLKDNVQISPNTPEKLNYFRTAIKNAYPAYKKMFDKHARPFDTFAETILRRHSRTILSQNIIFQQTYFKNPQYIERLIKDVMKAEEAKLNPEHTFTRDDYIEPGILTFENLLDRRYKTFLTINTKELKSDKLTLYNLVHRFFEEIISGIMLLERDLYNDSFIIWRSLLETTTTLLILIDNPTLTGKFIERKSIALMRAKLTKTTKEVHYDKSREAKAQLSSKNVSWYIAERFGWAGSLIKSDDYTLKTLLDIVKLGHLYPHYAFASLFVHEYLIRPEELAGTIDFSKYLFTLYFALYEEVRVHISTIFTNDLDDAKKLEEGIRAEVRTYSGQFKDFSLRIQNT